MGAAGERRGRGQDHVSAIVGCARTANRRAMVAPVFGISMGGCGAVTALVLAACFAAVATGVSMTRQSDFVRAGRREREPDATKPADAPGPAAG